jgi:mono/diheme cytochrome c family protein
MSLRHRTLTLAAGLSLTAAACASARPQTATIEPPAPGASDADFVLSRAAGEGNVATGEIDLFIGERWWPTRAAHLGVTEADARARDGMMSERQAPREFWDTQTAREAVATWTALCNECHGGRRTIEDARAMPAPAPSWGQGEGLFFGKRRPYADLFAIVSHGGPVRDGKPSEMPAWKGKLSREMIWSLIYFLEYQSGGIEGQFPPSLYPRGPEAKKTISGPR